MQIYIRLFFFLNLRVYISSFLTHLSLNLDEVARRLNKAGNYEHKILLSACKLMFFAGITFLYNHY